MDINEIEKKLKEFQATMKPLETVKKPTEKTGVKKPLPVKKTTPQEVIEAAGPPPFEPEPAPVTEGPMPAPAGMPCFNKCFIDLIKAIAPSGFIGEGTSEILINLVNPSMSQIPECSSISKIKGAS
jgi:hypothetical protein